MKKFLLVLIISLVSTSNLFAERFNWVDKMKTNDGATEFYIDKESVRVVNNYVYYWVLANYLKYSEDENKEIKSVINFHRLDCNDMGFQIILMSVYGEYMGKGESLSHFIDPDTEKRFHPKSAVSYARHEKLCNYY